MFRLAEQEAKQRQRVSQVSTICLPVCPSVCPSVSPSVCLSICLYVCPVAPTNILIYKRRREAEPPAALPPTGRTHFTSDAQLLRFEGIKPRRRWQRRLWPQVVLGLSPVSQLVKWQKNKSVWQTTFPFKGLQAGETETL